MKTLVLGLGNELLADDAAGILAARRLAPLLAGRATVLESSLSGVALLDLLSGYERAVILDAVRTSSHPPGAIIEIDPKSLRSIESPSPHYTGLPEMIALAGELGVEFPSDIRILAIAAEDLRTFGKDLSPPVAAAVDALVARVAAMVEGAGADR